MHVHYDIPGWPGIVLQAALLAIILGYIMIAWQFWSARDIVVCDASEHLEDQEGAHKAVTQLFIIFILCALCGYAPRLIPFPAELMVGLHVLLAGVTWIYARSRQSVLIARALARAG